MYEDEGGVDRGVEDTWDQGGSQDVGFVVK